MNYDHLYHAGSPTDILKHSVLMILMQHFQESQKALWVLDTHGGAGIYDLSSLEARKTNEAEQGVIALMSAMKSQPASIGTDLETYGQFLQDFQYEMSDRPSPGKKPSRVRFYPGSPVVAQAMLQTGDLLTVCEAHGPVFRILKSYMGRIPGVNLYMEDGLRHMVNMHPRGKYPLVLIDPPYEKTSEEVDCERAILQAFRNWKNRGTIILWHPIKNPARTFTRYQAYQAALKEAGGINCLNLELMWDMAFSSTQLAGTGVMIFNCPAELKLRFDNLLKGISSSISGKTAIRGRAYWLAP